MRQLLVTYARQADSEYLHRADPAYWHPAYQQLLDRCRQPLVALGSYITTLTYGPIITGRRPRGCAAGVALVNQGQIAPTGVNLQQALRVPSDSPWAPARACLQRGDLVLARSGAGSVARNRLAIYLSPQPAAVGSFVDLVRLQGIEPVYVLLYLKSVWGWSQIHRLINGVATPNLNFNEIRGLQIATAPTTLQRQWRERYLQEVHPRHEAGDDRALAALQGLVGELEQYLSGEGP